MKIIPSDARRELYGLQVICNGTDNSYIDLMWARREKENPRNAKANCGWPVRLGDSRESNVTPVAIGAQEAAPPQTSIQNVTNIKKKASA